MLKSKHDAVQALTNLVAEARVLLALPLETELQLRLADAQRMAWQLQVKKVLHEMLGDSAGLVRLASPGLEPDAPQDPARTFQRTVLEHVVILDKLGLLLRQLA
jgi:hypothetical protein